MYFEHLQTYAMLYWNTICARKCVYILLIFENVKWITFRIHYCSIFYTVWAKNVFLYVFFTHCVFMLQGDEGNNSSQELLNELTTRSSPSYNNNGMYWAVFVECKGCTGFQCYGSLLRVVLWQETGFAILYLIIESPNISNVLLLFV